MGKTTELRKLIMTQLQTAPGGTYHKAALNNAAYPHKVFTLKSVIFQDARDDFELEVDVWDRNDNNDPKVAEDVADQVEALFRAANLPQGTILPTFYRESRYTLEDPDKNLQHIQLRFLVQLYEMEE